MAAAAALYEEFPVRRPPAEAIRVWQQTYTEWLGGVSYHPTTQAPDAVTYTRRYTPGLAILFAILLFPIGLLFLLMKRENVLTVRFTPGDEPATSVVQLSGSVSPAVIDDLRGVAEAHRAKVVEGPPTPTKSTT